MAEQGIVYNSGTAACLKLDLSHQAGLCFFPEICPLGLLGFAS